MAALRYLSVLLAFLLAACGPVQAADWQRPASLAGSWYPGDAVRLERSVQAFLESGKIFSPEGKVFAVITPHAGHVYSGAVAGKAWSLVSRLKPAPETVILLGPSHHYALDSPSIWPRGSLDTPLGPIEVDHACAKKLAESSGAVFMRGAHLKEHCLEVQLPFIKKALPQAKIVAMITGRPDAQKARALGSALAGAARDKAVLLAASTDLSHFHTQKKAESLDVRLAGFVAKLDPEGLLAAYGKGRVEACGIQALAAVMFAARELGADRGQVLAQTTSASVNNDSTRVVGYLSAALVKSEPGSKASPNGLSPAHTGYLLDLAKQALHACVKGQSLELPKDLDPVLTRKRAVFVTLRKSGRLRGCIGYLEARDPLYRAVVYMTRAAALEDPRFRPVAPDELDDISISISVLTPMTPVRPGQVKVGRDGVLIRMSGRAGVFLPQVPVEQGWDREQYLDELCHKAGLPAGAWRDERAKLWSFEAEVLK